MSLYKNLKKRKLYSEQENNYKLNKTIQSHTILIDFSSFYINFYFLFENKALLSELRNICIFTGRARGVYRSFKLSRMVIKNQFVLKKLIGIKRESW